MAYDVDLSRQSTNRNTVLAGLADLLSPYINITLPPYNAAGDGVTDDTAAIQAALDAGPCFFPPGTYVVSDELVASYSIHGDRATIDATTIPAGSAIGTAAIITVSGTESTSTSITSDVAVRAKVIPVASTAGWAANDILLLKSDQDYLNTTTTTINRGMLARVASVDSATQVTLQEPLDFSITVSGNFANARKINAVRDVTIEGLKFIGDGDNQVMNAVIAEYVDNLTVQDCTITGCEDTGVSFFYAIDSTARRIQITGTTSPADTGLGTTGYGICFYTASRNCVAEDIHAYDCKDCVAGGGTYPVIKINVRNCHAYGCGVGGWSSFDCHEPCFDWTFTDCHVSGSLGPGFGIRGDRIRICGGSVRNTVAEGVRIKNYLTRSDAQDSIIISDLFIENTGGTGIQLGVDGLPASGVKISNVRIKDATFNGIQLAAGCSKIDISGLDWSGILGTATGTGGCGIRIAGTSSAHCSDISLANVRCSGSTKNAGIYAQYVDGLDMTACRFTENTEHGARLQNCTGVRVNGGRYESVTATGFLYPLYFHDCVDVTVCGAHVKGNAANANQSGIVIGNTTSGTNYAITGCYITDVGLNAIQSSNANYIAATGNIVYEAGNATKISLSGAANTVNANNL